MIIDKEFTKKYLLLSKDKKKDLLATLSDKEREQLLDEVSHLMEPLHSANDTSLVNEPPSHYGQKTMNFFSGMEEINDYDIEQMRKTSALQRLTNITDIIKTMYKEELQKPFIDLRLNFD